MATIYKTVLLGLALGAPLAAQVPDQPTAVVEGSVINIQNSRTIPRATVSLLRLKGGGGKSTRADGNGHFIFEHVEAGSYKLTAERQGFFSDARRREYQPVFEVADGQLLKNMPVRLMPAALVTGEIVDEYNDPVQEVEIKLLAIRMRLGQMVLSPAGKTVTDDRGQYRIPGLHPGRYYVVAEYKPARSSTADAVRTAVAQQVAQQTAAAGGRNGSADVGPLQPDAVEPAFTYPPLFYPATDDFQQAQAVVLRPGDEAAANFVMITAPVVSIQGRVTNGMTGAPAVKASISAYWTPYMEGDGLPARVSSQDGRFEIRGVAPGHYTLRANFSEDGRLYTGEQTVEVGIRGAQNVEIALLPDFVAIGHVRIGETHYSALSAATIEFAGEGLLPRVRAKAVPYEYKFEAQLRQDRRYHAIIRNLPEDFYLKSVALSGHEVSPDNVVVNGARGDVELIVSPAGGHVEGVLYDSKDQPTRGSILLIPDVPEPGPPDLFRRTSADGKGKFSLRGVAPGTYRLVAMEALNLDTEINSPEFLRTIGNRGDGLIVEESGKYTVSLRLAEEVR